MMYSPKKSESPYIGSKSAKLKKPLANPSTFKDAVDRVQPQPTSKKGTIMNIKHTINPYIQPSTLPKQSKREFKIGLIK